MNKFENIATRVKKFAADRDWNQFHSPKNLSMALSVEAAELLEHFQWLTEEQSRNLTPEKLTEVEEEIADVFIYLMRIANVLDIDLLGAADRKLEGNAVKYPINRSKGNAAKYTEFDE